MKSTLGAAGAWGEPPGYLHLHVKEQNCVSHAQVLFTALLPNTSYVRSIWVKAKDFIDCTLILV